LFYILKCFGNRARKRRLAMNKNSFDDLPAAALDRLPVAPEGAVTPTLDAAEYMGDLDGFDLTGAQKIEVLETLWQMMGAFARMGVEVDVCGLIFDAFNEASAPESGNARLIAPSDMETPSDDGEEGIA